MGSKILTFPVPAMGAQELREDLTNGNTHTCRAFSMTEPKAHTKEEGVYSHVCYPKRGGKVSSEDVWRSCLLCCLELKEEKLKSSCALLPCLRCLLACSFPERRFPTEVHVRPILRTGLMAQKSWGMLWQSLPYVQSERFFS